MRVGGVRWGGGRISLLRLGRRGGWWMREVLDGRATPFEVSSLSVTTQYERHHLSSMVPSLPCASARCC